MSCGCKRNEMLSKRRTKDLLGKKFGKLTAIENTHNSTKNGFVWKCKCDCGKIELFDVYSLTSGKTVECSECHKHGFKTFRSYVQSIRNQKLLENNKSLLDIL